MSTEKLGERVAVDNLSNNPLKNTGFSLEHPSVITQTPDANKQEVVSSASYLDAFSPASSAPAPAPGAPAAPESRAAAKPNAEAKVLPKNEELGSYAESKTLRNLREKFGIKSVKTMSLDMHGFKWSFRIPNKTDISWAIALVSDLLVSDSVDLPAGYDKLSSLSGRNYVNTALVAISIAAIDDVPIYKHFGIDTGDVQIKDALFPPRHIRLQSAGLLYDLLAEGIFPELITELQNFYFENVEAEVRKNLVSPLV